MKNILKATTALALVVYTITPSFAFYQTTDKTEAYTILPNESAFWIPDVGDNKNTQTQMDSEQYFKDNKVATKLFVIPHHKLSGSGGTSFLSGWDAYVPNGRLIIVSRAPQSREWVKDAHRGTSKEDESFPCQSKEGLNIRVGVSIGVEVKESDAARFLYHFGVLPPTTVGSDGKTYFADRSDPSTIFTSVYYGRSLESVTDDVVRKRVQTIMCDAIAGETFDNANADQVKIMETVRKESTTYLIDFGITLDFIGYADTWTFDPEVQHAINQKYEAITLAPEMPALQALNNLQVQEGLAKGLEAHGLPVVIPSNLLEMIKDLASGLVKK